MMDDDDEGKAAKFRADAADQGLILVTPNEGEPRFTFVLTHGTITTSRYWGKLAQLLALAKACWGDDGDFDELQCMMARRDDIRPTIDVPNLVWSLDLDEDEGVQFTDWLSDHILLPLALLRAQDPS